MDSYLASNDYRKADHYFFNLNLEVLSGCQFNCKGCHVNKVLEHEAITEEQGNKLLNLLDTLNQDGTYKTFIAFIGPTDFLTADNTLEVLKQKEMVRVLNQFKRLSFQTTALNISKAEEFAKLLKEYYPSHELEINVLIEPEHVTNDKYINTLIQNRDKLFQILDWPTPVRTFAIMNLYDYTNVRKQSIAEILKDYEYMHSFTKDLFETTIDFNFSFGRKAQLSKQEFLQATEQIKALFNTGVNDRTVDFIRFSFGKLLDSLVEYQFNYLDGKLYASPLLYERYVSFIPELVIPLEEWTIQEIEDYIYNENLNQFTNAFTYSECGDCQYLKMCVDRQILTLMNAYGLTDCMVAKGALEEINGQPNPYKDKKSRQYYIPIQTA